MKSIFTEKSILKAKSWLKFKRYLFTLFLLQFLFINAFSQTAAISGTVKDAKGDGLPGVSVRVKNNPTAGTVTNTDGRYTLRVPGKQAILVFSLVGYKPAESAVNDKTEINITLEENVSALNEVVVTGYRNVVRRDLTGSVGIADVPDMQKAPVLSFEDALAGRVAGVQVSSNDGQPGATNNILIRGVGSISQSSSPLWVIDGVAMEAPDNNLIDPANVESITVLKDASSTAIYGARGSNGVIVVTTKRGQSGPSHIDYSVNYGLNVPYKYMQLLNPYQFVQAASDFYGSGTNAYLSSGQTLEDYRNVTGTDWQGKLLRNAGQLNNTISVSGGNNGTTYSFTGNATQQQGIVINSAYHRYQGRLTLDQKVGERTKIGGSLSYTEGSQIGGSTVGSTTNSLFYSAYSYRPIPLPGTNPQAFDTSLYDPDNPTSGDYRTNPLLNAENQINNRISDYLTGSVYVNYNILKNLVLKVQGSLNSTNARQEVFNNANTSSGGQYSSSGVNGSILNTKTDVYNNTNLLEYNTQINHDHNIDVLVGTSLEEVKSAAYGFSSTHIPDDVLGLSGLDAGTLNAQATDILSYNTLVSGFGSVNYNYKEKYYITGTFRADGSSKFPQHQWSFFPSGAVKWKFTEEEFLKHQDILSDGNIRFSYGSSGNNRVGDFASYPTILFQNPLFLNGVNQGNSAQTTSLGNVDLEWETTTEKDLGFDFGFFKNKLNLTVDLYDRATSNLLYQAPLPTSSGFNSLTENIAGITNRGLEITLSGTIVNKKDFNYSASFNISFNRNRLDALADPTADAVSSIVNWDALFASTPAYIAKIGQPLGEIYGYIFDGLYQYSDFDKLPNGTYVLKPNVPSNSTTANRAAVQPGQDKFVDINGDGQIDQNDRTIIGHGYPTFIGGFNHSFRYKNFDANIFFQFSYGNGIINANDIYFGQGLGIEQRGATNPYQNAFAEFANRWTPTNQNTDIPAMKGVSTGVYSSFDVEDGSFLRVKTINIGYTLPIKTLSRYHISKLRVYVATNNVLTFTKYRGYDPEVSSYSSALTPGLDWSSYPRPITLTAGLNLTL